MEGKIRTIVEEDEIWDSEESVRSVSERASRFVEKRGRGRCLVIIVSLDTVRGEMETRSGQADETRQSVGHKNTF